jgi:hypothetical protein
VNNRSARIPRCTTLKGDGSFCDLASLEDVPFPICAQHALRLHAHLSELTDDELRGMAPKAKSRAPHTRSLRAHRNAALDLIQAGRSLVYAIRFPEGIIKIGCSKNLAQRIYAYQADGGELIGFMPGEYEDEQEIHRSLREHLARGREWYKSDPAVLAVANEMRRACNLEPLPSQAA